MKLFFLLFFIQIVWSLGLSATANSAEYEIFVNIPPTTPLGSRIFLTGNLPELCGWRPDCIELRPLTSSNNSASTNYSISANNSNWTLHAQFTLDRPPTNGSMQVKVTRGTWDSEASFQSGRTPENSFWDSKNSKVVLSIPHWKDLPPKTAPQNLLIYTQVYSPQLQNERTIRVLLPPNYNPYEYKKYPVIYAHDGQNLFDPATCLCGADWSLDLALERVTKNQGEGPKDFGRPAREAIVVGIDSINSIERFNEYDYLIRGKAYAHFIIDTLKPWIDNNFRTLPDRNNTYSLGSSMGGLISLALIWHHSDIFSAAAALSLPVFVHNKVIYEISATPKPQLPIRLYMDHGGIGKDFGYESFSKDYVTFLQGKGFHQNQDLIYLTFPYADHREIDWARRVDIPLRWLLL